MGIHTRRDPDRAASSANDIADFQPGGGNVHLSADTNDLRSNLRKYDLLHHERNRAQRKFDDLQHADLSFEFRNGPGRRCSQRICSQFDSVCCLRDQSSSGGHPNVHAGDITAFANCCFGQRRDSESDCDTAKRIRFTCKFCLLGSAGGGNVLF